MKRKVIIIFLAVMMIMQTGCSSEVQSEEHKIVIDECERKEYELAEVMKGDLIMTARFALNPDTLCRYDHSIWQDELKVDQLLVAIGDHVNKGQVMVTFKADKLDEEIEKYERRIEEDQLMYEYYTKLREKEQKKEKDKRVDYDQDIKEISDDMTVAQLYLDELYEEIAGYRIVAEESGIVTNIAPMLQTKTATKGTALICVTAGSGLYSVNTAEDVDFQVGQTYTAVYRDGIDVELQVISVEEADAGMADTSKENMRKIVFEPVGGILGVPENASLNLEVTGKQVNDVLYIPKSAVKPIGYSPTQNLNVAYVMCDDGFRESRIIEVGETVDDYIEIISGLEEGEKVTIK